MDDYLKSGKIQTNLEILSKPPPTGGGGSGISSPRRKDDLFLQGYGRQWGEKLTYSVGLAYGTGTLFGGTYGLAKGLRKGGATPKLFMNSLLNSCTTYGPSLANKAAVITIFYTGFNNLIQLATGQDEILNSTAAGALAGAMFKTGTTWRAAGKYSLASAGLFTCVDAAFRYGYV
eukprot:GHVQ01037887.1.p1 GENE.GHVQ01037887.1~~GHVQ01037887.1.p1  ORF type:complete len:175 (+),score=26.02 GHVQ01037887.1:168-692(+)